jgi:hypothetical protein
MLISLLMASVLNNVACLKMEQSYPGYSCSFLVTVTIGLYGYKANSGIRGYVASGESAPQVSLHQSVSGNRVSQLVFEVSLHQLVSGSRRDQSLKGALTVRSR